MRVTATKLRSNLYRILDEAVEKGTTVEVLRKGVVVKIAAAERPSKLSRLKKRSIYNGDMDEIVGMDWSKYWTELQ